MLALNFDFYCLHKESVVLISLGTKIEQLANVYYTNGLTAASTWTLLGWERIGIDKFILESSNII